MKKADQQAIINEVNERYRVVIELNQWYDRLFDNFRALGFNVEVDTTIDKHWMYLKHRNLLDFNVSFTYDREAKIIRFFGQNGSFVPDLNKPLVDFASTAKIYIRKRLMDNLRELDNVII